MWPEEKVRYSRYREIKIKITLAIHQKKNELKPNHDNKYI